MKHPLRNHGLVAKFHILEPFRLIFHDPIAPHAIGGEHGDVLLCVLGYGMLYNHAKAPVSAAQGLSEPWMWVWGQTKPDDL
jgi:hypothetical protein